MAKLYTLSEIKAHNERIKHYYFSRDTMRFFGQRMMDFKVRHVAGRVFVYAPRKQGWSFAEYDPKTGIIKGIIGCDTKADIISYLKSL